MKTLNDVSKRENQKDSTILLLGDKGVGKRSVVNAVNKKHVLGRNKTLPVEKMGSDFAAVDFSFLYVKDLSDREGATQHVHADDNLPQLHIWKVPESSKLDLLEAAVEPAHLQQMAVCIMVDL